DVISALPTAAPPRPQLLPAQGQLSSLVASVSLQLPPSFTAKRGETMTVSSPAWPRASDLANLLAFADDAPYDRVNGLRAFRPVGRRGRRSARASNAVPPGMAISSGMERQ